MKFILTLMLAARLLTGQVVSSDGTPIKGVAVSDGRTVVLTNARGRYSFRSDMPEGYVFISIPDGYEVPSEGLVPKFYTDIPKDAEFVLSPSDQSHCKILMMTDLHLTGDKVDNDLAQFRTMFFPPLCRAADSLRAEGNPVYTICLGDMCTNGKWYKNKFCYPEYLREMAAYPTPMFNIMGNHDNDEQCEGTPAQWESLSQGKYLKTFGPRYYSMTIGGIHFLMLDDIITHGPKTDDNPAQTFVGKNGYTYDVDKAQMKWIAEDLKRVPKDSPLVVCLHVPPYYDAQKQMPHAEDFLSLFSSRRNVHLFAGHFHTTRMDYLTPDILQHMLASGSAVSWKLNDLQAPVVCDDGTPGGWQVLSIDKGRLSWQFQSMYRSVEDSQISVFDEGDGNILVDVFNWDPQWKISATCCGKSVELGQIWSRNPDYERIRRDTKMLLKRPTAFLGCDAPHYFRCHIDGGDPSSFEVEAVDRFGNRYKARYGQKAYPQWGMPTVTVFEKGEGGYDTFRIPAVVKASDGSLLAFAEARKHSASDSGDIDLVMKKSTDSGISWCPMRTIWDDGDNVCGNPCPVVDAESGRIVMVMTWNDGRDPEADIHSRKSIDTRRVFCTLSDDNGESWTAPREITSSAKLPEWTWYATGPCHGLQLSSGRIVIPCNHGIYGQNGPDGTVSHIIYSDNLGEAWHIGGICPVGNESTAAALPDGSLILNMRRWKGTEPEKPYRLVAVSRDEGESFSTPEYDGLLPDPRCQASLLYYDGLLYFSNPAMLKGRSDMTVKCSPDGAAWETVATLPGAKAAYSDIVGLDGGKLGILYETGTESPYEKIVFAHIGIDR